MWLADVGSRCNFGKNVSFGVRTCRAGTDHIYNDKTDRVTIRTREEWQEGEQVFLCYGGNPNSDLLLSYGFVEQDNPMVTDRA